jgi:dihydroorotase
MVKTYELLNQRFPILDVVIEHLTCSDTEKFLLKDLFVTVYGVATETRKPRNSPLFTGATWLLKWPR